MRTGIVIALFMIADSLAHAGFVSNPNPALASFDTWAGVIPMVGVLLMSTAQDIREIVKQRGHH